MYLAIITCTSSIFSLVFRFANTCNVPELFATFTFATDQQNTSFTMHQENGLHHRGRDTCIRDIIYNVVSLINSV
jgi:hypothetical protein